jgi:putative addiction module killer protein
MPRIVQSDTFSSWLRGLNDVNAELRIVSRIRRMELGNPGDVKSVGEGVSEMRIDYGPGYRLYYTRRGSAVIILLCGGDKKSQSRDIRMAQKMAKEV